MHARKTRSFSQTPGTGTEANSDLLGAKFERRQPSSPRPLSNGAAKATVDRGRIAETVCAPLRRAWLHHTSAHTNTRTNTHTHTHTLVSLSRRHWWRCLYAGHHTTRGSVKRDLQAINSFANLHTKLHTPQGLHRGGTRRRQDGQAHECNHASKRRHEMAS